MTDTRALQSVSDPSDGRTAAEAVLFEIRRVIVGQDAMLERVLVALSGGGQSADPSLSTATPAT